MESSTAPASKRNIEIKARIANDEEFEKRVKIAKKLTNTDGEIIPQYDVFFNVTNGRLKLRYEKVSFGFKNKFNSLPNFAKFIPEC